MADNVSVQVKGLDKVMASLKRVSNPEALCDQALRTTVLNSLSDLQRNSVSQNPKISGMNTGSTARAWTSPLKVSAGHYRVSNAYKTRDGKRNVVTLIDQGHGEITPSKTFLYIPLNKKAAMKKPGDNIPDEYKRGEDYVFARRVKPLAGRFFIDKNVKAASKELTQRIIQAVRAAIK